MINSISTLMHGFLTCSDADVTGHFIFRTPRLAPPSSNTLECCVDCRNPYGKLRNELYKLVIVFLFIISGFLAWNIPTTYTDVYLLMFSFVFEIISYRCGSENKEVWLVWECIIWRSYSRTKDHYLLQLSGELATLTTYSMSEIGPYY